jgi:hypothetical protein
MKGEIAMAAANIPRLPLGLNHQSANAMPMNGIVIKKMSMNKPKLAA